MTLTAVAEQAVTDTTVAAAKPKRRMDPSLRALGALARQLETVSEAERRAAIRWLADRYHVALG